MSRALDVYLHNRLCGRFNQDDDGQLSFVYNGDYLTTKGSPVSIAMPLTEQAYTHNVAHPFFSGLLPDERARQNLASALGISRGNTFGLLEIIGGECAGALTIMPPGVEPPAPDNSEPRLLNEQQLTDLLRTLRQRPLMAGEQGIRLSLAGAQDKLAVCLHNGQIALARDGRPTTHILKPFIEGLHGTVENEWFCMTLASRVGLNAPTVTQARAGDIRYLLIERYDRHIEPDGTIKREHQEDFCQALSVPPELKYEAEGGPGVTALETMIRQHARRPAADVLQLQRMLIFHYLIDNADAHAKNYALLYRQTVPDLAPMYDALSTAVYPRLSKQLAMKIGGRSLPDTIQQSHWFDLVPDTKAAQRNLAKEIESMAAKVQEASVTLIERAKAEDNYHKVLMEISAVINTRAKLLSRYPHNL